MKPFLRYFLLIVLLGLQVLTFTAILASSRVNTEVVLRDHAREVMNHLATNAADNSRRFLSPAERAAQLSEELLTKNVLSIENQEELESYFLEQLRTNPELKRCSKRRLPRMQRVVHQCTLPKHQNAPRFNTQLVTLSNSEIHF